MGRESIFLAAVTGAMLFASSPAYSQWSTDQSNCVDGKTPIADSTWQLERYVKAAQNQPRTVYLNRAAPERQPYELHVVGSYESSGDITIERTKKPVVLIIAAYEPGDWKINLRAGARLSKIILQGHQEQRISNPPPRVEIISRGRCGDAYQWEPPSPFTGPFQRRYAKFIREVQKFTGLIETSFQGGYKVDTTYSIPPAIGRMIKKPLVFRDPSIKETRAETLKRYRNYRDGLPAGLASTFSVLIQAMEKKTLPVHFASDGGGSNRHPARYFEALPMPAMHTVATGKRFTCDPTQDAAIETDAADNFVRCSSSNQIYFTGPGRDIINDSWGNDLIDGGAGNDVIDAGWGRDIVVFQKDWGRDVVSTTCHHERVPPPSKMFGGNRNKDWKWRFMNFIVFGPGIDPGNMHWAKSNKLVHKPTGASVTFNDKCFNIVFVEPGKLRPWTPPKVVNSHLKSRSKMENKDRRQRMWDIQEHHRAVRRICAADKDNKLCPHLRGLRIIK